YADNNDSSRSRSRSRSANFVRNFRKRMYTNVAKAAMMLKMYIVNPSFRCTTASSGMPRITRLNCYFDLIYSLPIGHRSP
ncbi:hypothetical protein AC249_AIPGENE23632, partial [Exaiptasia diaphana]